MSTESNQKSDSAGSAGSTPEGQTEVTAFDLVGGEARVRELVDRFYDLMDLETQFAGLRAIHPPSLEGSRDKLFWFLCGWLGGPNHFIERFGHPRLRARHMPFEIGVSERDQWMRCMALAMQDVGLPEDLQLRLMQAFFQTADWMRNVAR
ncbi:globin [Cupriavidus sp. TA19]|uniref:group II truncated hemoglobin n=1 Tax=unclassified Cupriavidus TaxID=2640874 RepID=UPI000EE0EB56|nr:MULTISPECIES: group II truncated hemoglobin [unclassified Cupriavidus]BDB23560.1 group II truncated hemoglobin [Cupriavidus sp. P-10]GLC95857.1 globin [Cupriavidus sp. TA19]